MNICILIPIFNEAKTIGKLVRDIKKQNYDVVVIDDGSTDGSGEIAESQGAIIISNKQRSGKGGAIKNGFDYVLKQNYVGVIMMDGDAQHSPEDISVFVEEAKKNPERVITGNRMQDSKAMPFVRKLTNQFMSFLISCACKQNIPDTQCGYRYIGCDVLRMIRFRLKCSGFEIETEILMKAYKQGFEIASVPVKTIYQDEESKINPLKDTVRFFTYFLKEIMSP